MKCVTFVSQASHKGMFPATPLSLQTATRISDRPRLKLSNAMEPRKNKTVVFSTKMKRKVFQKIISSKYKGLGSLGLVLLSHGCLWKTYHERSTCGTDNWGLSPASISFPGRQVAYKWLPNPMQAFSQPRETLNSHQRLYLSQKGLPKLFQSSQCTETVGDVIK